MTAICIVHCHYSVLSSSTAHFVYPQTDGFGQPDMLTIQINAGNFFKPKRTYYKKTSVNPQRLKPWHLAST